jgi:hypothetical protein
MTYTFKLARRLAVSRHLDMLAVLVLVAACTGDTTGPDATAAPSSPAVQLFRVVPGAVTVQTAQPIRFRGESRSGDLFASPLTWEATGGTISANGTFLASRPGTYKVVGRGRGRQKPDTSVVVVVPPQPTLTGVEITPASATVNSTETHSFAAAGRLADGATASIGVTWSATGGSIDAGGQYRAGSIPGVFRVVAASIDGTLADTASVTVVIPTPSPTPEPTPEPTPDPPAPTLARVILLPASATLATGADKRFAAFGRNSNGDSVAVTVAFTATGGTVTSGGLYTAGAAAGTFRVVASAEGLADTSVVTLATTAATPLPPLEPSPSLSTGVPFGPFGAWEGVTLKPYTEPFTSSIGAYTSDNILERLSVARSKGLKLVLAMTGGARSQYLTDGAFDFAKWKARMDSYNTSAIKQAVAAAVAEGVVVGNSVMDEPFNIGGPGNEANSWGPRGTMTKAKVDEMCRYVKSIFPTLPAGVVHDHDDFEPTESYAVCDFFVSQYRMGKGDVRTFRDAGLALARRDGHRVAFSMNILDGGQRDNDNDGVWECPQPLTGGQGSYYPNCRMTADQVREFGNVLGEAGCAMLMWRYDTAFMADPDNARAFKDLAARLGSLPRKSCSR